MKGVFTSLTALALSTISYAQPVQISGLHIIEYDNVLDGQLVSTLTKEFSFHGENQNFVAQNQSEALSGFMSRDEQLIRFTLSDSNNGTLTYFTGQFNGQSYSGTWHANKGARGDWRILISQPAQLQSCREILLAGKSTGDGLYEVIDEAGLPMQVYCDMTSDGGGWTLVGSYPKDKPGGVQYISQYGTEPALTPYNPTRLWLYQGGLSMFSDAREQISCSKENCSDGKVVYGLGLSTSALELVRYSWGYQDRVDHMPSWSNVPSCQTSLNDPQTRVEGCVVDGHIGLANDTSRIGWQADVNGHYCWAARGTYKPGSPGSAVCQSGREPNGTKWALLWMR
ncbi:hypothetical protein L1285_20545 [Pseudoalteromonas sp. DL2-H2.2]|uniref:fibrinogen-like YCDxxxxGGGW domain-containing protein n=1 Tax=Pseudoalteromonas sp. DL2-H2.2 TaxID=2908889 RepID=UPI001F45CAB4|nr:fibrinogen-like YCDxxxxGGGW domain-containing protein [Pseudoalteromonas sp. DL2-H2.2]MCF2910701.1 hypothetical protein [Pseudoalteromonas sp. DL2-H2.2]